MNEFLENIEKLEDEYTEFKDKFNFVINGQEYKHRIYNTIKAFANTYGGELFIGINDNGTIVGIDENLVDEISRDITSKLGKEINFEIEIKKSKFNKIYLIIHIEEKDNLIYEKDGSVYIRKNASTYKIKGSEIQNFLDCKKLFSNMMNTFIKNIFNINLMINWRYKLKERNIFLENYNFFSKNIRNFFNNAKLIAVPTDGGFFSTAILSKPKFINDFLVIKFDIFYSYLLEKIFKIKVMSESLGTSFVFYVVSINIYFDKFLNIHDYNLIFDDSLHKIDIEKFKNNITKNSDIYIHLTEENKFYLEKSAKEIILIIKEKFENKKSEYINKVLDYLRNNDKK